VSDSWLLRDWKGFGYVITLIKRPKDKRCYISKSDNSEKVENVLMHDALL
jgi:hypothetical protein